MGNFEKDLELISSNKNLTKKDLDILKSKRFEYSFKINSAIEEILSNEEADNYIDPKELGNGDNLTEFFHALCNMVPTRYYQEFVDDNVDNLKVNHIANILCFQFGEIKSEEDETDNTPQGEQ